MTSWPNWVWSSRGPEPEPKDFADLAAKFRRAPGCGTALHHAAALHASGHHQADNIGHFGLAPSLKSYAHFTSPIRRYPDPHPAPGDQVPDRQGAAGNLRHKWTPSGGYHYQLEEVDPMGEHCSMTENAVPMMPPATWQTGSSASTCWITWVTSLTASSPASPVLASSCVWRRSIDGLVHVSTLTNDYYQFDPLHQQLIGENFRRRYRLGDKVRVKVMGVNLDDRKIDFVMVEEPLKATGKNAKRWRANRPRSRKRRPRAPSATRNARGQGERQIRQGRPCSKGHLQQQTTEQKAFGQRSSSSLDII